MDCSMALEVAEFEESLFSEWERLHRALYETREYSWTELMQLKIAMFKLDRIYEHALKEAEKWVIE